RNADLYRLDPLRLLLHLEEGSARLVIFGPAGRKRSPMIPDEVKSLPLVTALLNTAPDAVLGGKFDRAEVTLEINAEHIVGVCAYLRQVQNFVRLSTVTGVDWY